MTAESPMTATLSEGSRHEKSRAQSRKCKPATHKLIIVQEQVGE